MKIVISAVSAKMGGPVTYITNLLCHLSEVEGDFEFMAFLPPETAAKVGGLGPKVRVLTTEIGHAGALKRVVWEQIRLRRFLKRQRADVLFSTTNIGMFHCPVRQILLVRNSLYFSRIYREMFLSKHSLRFYIGFALRRWLICQSARCADVVMTPTQAMLDELRSFANVKNVLVNPYGVTGPPSIGTVQGSGRQRAEETGGRVVRLLYVSLYSEHKNLNTLLKALLLLNRNGGTRFILKTTADPGWAGAAWTLTRREDLRLARQPGIVEYVEFVGPVNRKETLDLYREADIFVFPSLIESFGFPMAEAMSYGLPIVAADTPVNREVCGDSAVYFSPLSAEHLADRVLQLVNDHSLRNLLSAKAQQAAASRFSWTLHARRIKEAALPENPTAVQNDCLINFAQ